MRETIIRNAVRNIKEFGYPSVNESNIFNNEIYSKFFKKMLEENMGFSEEVDKEIKLLLSEIVE